MHIYFMDNTTSSDGLSTAALEDTAFGGRQQRPKKRLDLKKMLKRPKTVYEGAPV